MAAPLNHMIVKSTRAHALLPYPRGFHNDAGDSGCVTPVSSHALAVRLIGPGPTSTVIDHSGQDHGLITGCRSACCQLRPSSRETSTRPMPRPSPARAHPLIVSGPAGICISSPGIRMSQLRGSDDNEMPSPGAAVSGSASAGSMR